MATTRPGIAFDNMIEICNDVPGVNVEEKAGWIKVSGPHGDSGPRIYLQRRNLVRQVDFSNFAEEQLEKLSPTLIPAEGNGKVQAQLDLSKDGWDMTLKLALQIVATSEATGNPRARGAQSAPHLADAVPELK